MGYSFRSLRQSLMVFVALLCSQQALAWDSVGHRLTTRIALHYLEESTARYLQEILQEHPRFQQDFVDQMPSSIARGDEVEQRAWLLGQAAFWPDIARGIIESEREKYNRPNWHYIDGAWLRGEADTQGNTYLGVSPLDDILGEVVNSEDEVANIMNALDYNAALLSSEETSPDLRAVALCWVLHLVGDIHQPLHVGSLYTANRFSNGDRGGNGIQTDDGTLHARWDRALSAAGVNPSLEVILEQHSQTLQDMEESEDEEWSLWMKESRALLLNTVYSEEMKTSILRSDDSSAEAETFTLSESYVDTMEYHAQLRLALAGRRLSIWFEENI